MKTLHGTFQDETLESQHAARRYNPATEFVFTSQGKQYTITISSGRDDVVSVFEDDGSVFVISENHSMGYLGAEVFTKSDNGYELSQSVFFQNESDFPECLQDWEDMSGYNLAKIIQTNCL